MSSKRFIALLIGAALLTVSAAADGLPLRDYSAMADRFAANPRNVKDIGDPFVLPLEGGYQVFATGGPIGFFTWRSADLKTFERSKALQKVSWASGDYWAPEVFAADGRWVMLYTVRSKATGGLRTGIAFADAPEGPYAETLEGPLMELGYATIDATMTWDDEGNPYLIYVRDCSENEVSGRHESHIYGVRLKRDLTGIEGEPVLLTRPEGEWETRSGDWRWNEGPAVVKHGGKYYLFYSVNAYYMKEYSVCAAVADSPLGPYVKQANNPLLAPVEGEKGVIVSGPGHNAFFEAGGELFTAYHTHTYPLAPSGNRQLCVDRAGFHADGTAFICGPTLAPQLRPLTDLGLVNRMAQALPEEATALLTDGDTCVAETSKPYLWRGTEAAFRWETPVTADLLMLWPAPGEAVSGTVTVNGSLEAAFSLEAGGLPGAAVILPFEPVQVESLEIRLDQEAALGEVLLVGAE
ncbi:MAG: glycoside hydrolase family 43 protein [Clostridia bacterium]|nr:glycoside hydrolase family 43 protein [Clostridia bacterium]